MAIKIKVFFRPLVINPNKKLLINAPSGTNEATDDASSIVILPIANGDWSDVKRFTLGLAQPAVIPNPSGSIFTVRICFCLNRQKILRNIKENKKKKKREKNRDSKSSCGLLKRD